MDVHLSDIFGPCAQIIVPRRIIYLQIPLPPRTLKIVGPLCIIYSSDDGPKRYLPIIMRNPFRKCTAILAVVLIKRDQHIFISAIKV